MRRPRVVFLSVWLALTAASCDGGPADTAPTQAPTSATTSSTTMTPPPTGGGELPPPVCLAGTEPFQEDGNAGTVTAPPSDATIVTDIRWTVESGCERVTISFATAEGAPAVAPPTVASSLIRDSAVLRINLSEEVTGSAIADQLVDTGLVERVYVVRSPNGTLFVDVHLGDAALARVGSQGSPARAVIDLRPGGAPYRGRATRSDGVVVVEPVVGPVRYPFSMSGYVRTGADAVDAILRSTGSEEQRVSSGSVPGQDDTWAGYVVLFADGPQGRIAVEVGGEVTVELSVS